MLICTWLVARVLAQEAPVVEEKPDPWDRVGWGFGGLPAVNYNSDEGFGFGVVGSIYRYDGHTSPYKTAVNLVLFATTKGVQNHALEVDTLELGGRPIRATVRGEFAATNTSNYCGIGPEVTCDPAVAEQEADAAGLAGEQREDFVRRYYRSRFLNPNGTVNFRWAIDPMPHRVELLLGWRANAMIPGDFREDSPWPGSLYAQDFPGGERGLVSVLQAGVMVDNRDNEPAPIRGYWAETTVRAASFLLGSDYDYVGFNVTLRGYAPVGTDRLVFADRVMFDGLSGEAHTLELATPGGSQRYTFFGGLNAGRGIRQRRYIGKCKAMEQAELRYTLASPVIAGILFDVSVLAFGEVGFVGAELGDVESAFTHPLPAMGGGLRIAVDRNFVVRADVGVSPIEEYAPSVYIDLRNVF